MCRGAGLKVTWCSRPVGRFAVGRFAVPRRSRHLCIRSSRPQGGAVTLLPSHPELTHSRSSLPLPLYGSGCSNLPLAALLADFRLAALSANGMAARCRRRPMGVKGAGLREVRAGRDAHVEPCKVLWGWGGCRGGGGSYGGALKGVGGWEGSKGGVPIREGPYRGIPVEVGVLMEQELCEGGVEVITGLGGLCYGGGGRFLWRGLYGGSLWGGPYKGSGSL